MEYPSALLETHETLQRKESWSQIQDLANEYVSIRDSTGNGTRVYNRTERQIAIANEIIEFTLPLIISSARELNYGRRSLNPQEGYTGFPTRLFGHYFLFHREYDIDDLVQVGVERFIHNLCEYDPSWKISTFIANKVKQGGLEKSDTMDYLVRISGAVRPAILKVYRRATKEVHDFSEGVPKFCDILSMCQDPESPGNPIIPDHNIPDGDNSICYALMFASLSGDYPELSELISAESSKDLVEPHSLEVVDEGTLDPLCYSEMPPSPLTVLLIKDAAREIDRILEHVTPRQQMIFRSIYGYRRPQERQSEIAKRLSVTHQAVSNTFLRANQTFKEEAEREGVPEYILLLSA